jgi:3-deoxy-D-manno-octulosonic-acid transferase/heptosyltransferase-1
LRDGDICVERVDIDCRTDCHRRACSKWICMDIEVDRVFQAVSERLKLGRAFLPVMPGL